ncbi:MAG: ComEC/Rec2 family competence protein [Planctomycetes bacterium]|nr:ComEC/Rec2 family competence protein [Planctomycetota bacterium]
MEPKRRPSLPLLLRGALSLCLAALWPWPLEFALALVALVALWRPRATPWLGCGLIGLFLAFSREDDSASTRFCGWLRARSDTWRSSRGGEITLVELCGPQGASDRQAFLVGATTRLENGDWIEWSGELESSRRPRNPGGSREPARLRPSAAAGGPSVAPAPRESAPLSMLAAIRRQLDALGTMLERRLRAHLSPEAAALAGSLALGRSDELGATLRQQLKQCGAWHLFAVSGSHVVLLAALLERLLPRRPRGAVVPLRCVGVLCFVLLSGGQAPAWRAAVSHLVHTIARARTIVACSASTLAAAFLALLSIDGGLLKDPGVQLSFAAVFALLVAARHGPSRSPRGTGHGIRLERPLLQALRCACFAAVATAPLTAFHFGTVSCFAPIATLLLAPFVTVALLLSMVCCTLTWLPAEWCWPAELALSALSTVIAALAEWLAVLPGSPLVTEAPGLVVMLLLGGSWVALLARRPRIGVAAAALAVCVQFAPVHQVGAYPVDSQLADAPAVVFDVGHGQAVLLRTAGRTDLLDAGGRDQGSGRALVAALRALHVERIDTLLLSHLDADHCVAAPALLDAFKVGEVLLTADAAAELVTTREPLLRSLADSIANHDRLIRVVAAGARFGPHEVVWPPAGRRFAARNEGSIAVAIEFGASTWLAPGDLEGYPLVELSVLMATRPAIDLLLLPHHGNADEALRTLLERTRTTRAFASRSTTTLPSATEQALRPLGVVWRSTARSGALGWTPQRSPP